MRNQPVAVSILTNGHRLEYLQRCVTSFLTWCSYRPLTIAIFDNGSSDGTKDWLHAQKDFYGVTFRKESSPNDLGCAAGTNASFGMVRDHEFCVHIESDFEHTSSVISGEDKMWLHRAMKHMEYTSANYLYLRRMTGIYEMAMHWWDQWMSKVYLKDQRYLMCPDFWWSNNPALIRTDAVYNLGILPLDVSKDGNKGTKEWSNPELSAGNPKNTWIHKWGLFVHEMAKQPLVSSMMTGCQKTEWAGGCKYGFFEDGKSGFCKTCDRNGSFADMSKHRDRFECKK